MERAHLDAEESSKRRSVFVTVTWPRRLSDIGSFRLIKGRAFSSGHSEMDVKTLHQKGSYSFRL